VFKEEHAMRWIANGIRFSQTKLIAAALFAAMFVAIVRADAPPSDDAPPPPPAGTRRSPVMKEVPPDNDWAKPQGATEPKASQPAREENQPRPAKAPSAFATKFEDPAPHAADKVGAAEFNGVKPGVTLSDQLEKLWGVGKEVSKEGDFSQLTFSLTDFPRVDVTLDKNTVQSVVIHLQTAMPPAALAEKLEVNDVRPVMVPDDVGAILGQLYPEHGVLFNFATDGKRVLQVALEPVDVDSFLLRAETNLQMHCRDSLADIDYVLKLQPANARASWLRARLLSQFARYEEALAAVQAALAAEPKNSEFRLTLAEILGACERYDEAAREIKDVLATAELAGELKARGLCLLGDLLAASPAHDYKQAMEHHVSAIQLADPLSINDHLAVRRASKMVLIDAHLGVAHDIAAGVFQQKERIVPKWLSRASAYVQDFIDAEGGDPALRIRMARGALAACAASQGKLDSEPWTKLALQNGKELITKSDDSWRKSRLEWELGAALAEGLTAEDQSGVTRHTLANSTMTATYLESGAKDRRETPEDVFRLGRVYYRIGALHAVQRNDHKTAVTWYEKAVPLLDRPLPTGFRDEQGRYGEWYVSMGISFWEVDQGDFAVQLTDAGLKHVEEAVARQLLDRKALAVPYNNLATMHEKLGHQNEAKNFAELAAKSEGTTRR
jgi:tetratricopeptide (TPR) repeat protein